MRSRTNTTTYYSSREQQLLRISPITHPISMLICNLCHKVTSFTVFIYYSQIFIRNSMAASCIFYAIAYHQSYLLHFDMEFHPSTSERFHPSTSERVPIRSLLQKQKEENNIRFYRQCNGYTEMVETEKTEHQMPVVIKQSFILTEVKLLWK